MRWSGRHRNWFLAAIATGAVLTGTAFQASYTISDNVNLVLLDVSVKHPKGGYVAGLNREDFKVFEDGRLRPISHFTSRDTPVTVGLVLDNSGSMRAKRPEVVTAGLAFAKESNPQDEFFVVNFNNRIYLGLPRNLQFTDQLQILRSALYLGRPEGQTALYDAVKLGLKHLEGSRRDKRTLIVVSDGGDNVSGTKLAELMEMVEASRATIYTVGLLDPEDHDLNPAVLRKLASVSGGEFFAPEKLQDVSQIFHKISQDIRNRYGIAYTPDEVNNKRAVRSVRVAAEQNGRKLSVRTRTTYAIRPLRELVANDTAPATEMDK